MVYWNCNHGPLGSQTCWQEEQKALSRFFCWIWFLYVHNITIRWELCTYGIRTLLYGANKSFTSSDRLGISSWTCVNRLLNHGWNNLRNFSGFDIFYINYIFLGQSRMARNFSARLSRITGSFIYLLVYTRVTQTACRTKQTNRVSRKFGNNCQMESGRAWVRPKWSWPFQNFQK